MSVTLRAMTKGKTKSKLTLKERRHEAFRMFGQGASDVFIAKKLKVDRKTVSGYRARYEDQLEKEAVGNPRLLQDVLKNTIRSLRELDQIREDAWSRLNSKIRKVKAPCSECGEEATFEIDLPPTDQVRVQYQNVLLKAQDQRAKLYGVTGVKAEAMNMTINVGIVQGKLLEWMQRNLCASDSERLATFIETELAEFMPSMQALPSFIDVESEEL